MLYILSQVFVGIADFLFVLSMLSKNKKWIVLFLAFSDAFFATHYFFLDKGLTGAVVVFIDLAYLVTVALFQHFKKENFILPSTLIAICGVVVATIFTWQGAISLLPLFSMLVYLVGMIFKNTIIVKGGACIRNALNIAYMLLITSWLGAGLECCLLISAIVGIVLDLKRKKKDLKLENTESSNNQQKS